MSDDVFREITELDKLIHEPARLSILTALSVAVNSDFQFLQSVTGLSKGNLSSHLSKLSEAGLIEITKKFRFQKPFTEISITSSGIEAIQNHWKKLDALQKAANNWENPNST